jgi:hypothetical protein
MISFTPRPFFLRGKGPGCSVSPRTSLDGVGRRKSYPYLYLNSDPSAVQHVTIRYADWAIQALYTYTYNGKFVPVFNYLSTIPWEHMAKWWYTSTIFSLDTRGRWMVSSHPWAPGTHWIGSWTVWTLWRREKLFTAGNRTRAVQPVFRRYSDWAAWLLHICMYIFKCLDEKLHHFYTRWLFSVRLSLDIPCKPKAIFVFYICL